MARRKYIDATDWPITFLFSRLMAELKSGRAGSPALLTREQVEAIWLDGKRSAGMEALQAFRLDLVTREEMNSAISEAVRDA